MSSAATRSAKVVRLGLSREKGDEIVGFLLVAAFAGLLAALVSYHPLDPSWMHRTAELSPSVRNFIGPIGAQVSSLLFAVWGVASFLLPVLLAAAAWRRWRHLEREDGFGRYLGLAALLVVV